MNWVRLVRFSEENSKEILDNFPVGLATFKDDEDFTLLYANSDFYRVIGYSEDDFKKELSSSLKKLVCDECLAEFEKNIYRGNSTFYEVRIVNRNKNIVALEFKSSPKDGEIHIVIIESSNLLKKASESMFQLECFSAVAEIADDIVFKYDIENDFMRFENKYSVLFGRPNKIIDFCKTIEKQDFIYYDDIPTLKEYFSKALEKNKRREFELRMKNRDGKYEWYSVAFKTIFDDSKKLKSIIGKIFNINKQKTEQKLLIEKSQIDGLTGLYNKAATETIMNNMLMDNYESVAALLIVDIDNFKTINDTYGHLFGDAVLADVANIFKKLFRETDIIGRIGGDEFIILMCNMNSEDIVYKKAKLVCEEVRSLYGKEDGMEKMSVSMGVAISKNAITLYKDLFKKADMALYETKQRGKNGFTVYDEEKYSQDNFSNSDTDRFSDADALKIKNSVLKWIEETDNYDDVFSKILKTLGEKLAVSRTYIYLIKDDKTAFYNKYQWYGENIKEISGGMKELPYKSDVSDIDYFSFFNREDIFYCVESSNLVYPFNEYMNFLENTSVLEVLLYRKNIPIGFLGIAECNSKKLWLQRHIDMLTILSQIISNYI